MPDVARPASSASVSRVLNQLEESGDLVRIAHAAPEDGRAILLELTEQGLHIETEIVTAMVSSLTDSSKPLRLATELLVSTGDPTHRSRQDTTSRSSTEPAIVALGRIGVILTGIMTSALDDIEVNAALAREAFRARLVAQGTEPAPMTQEAFRAFIATDRERWARVIRDGNIKVD